MSLITANILIDDLEGIIDELADRGYHVTFVYSSSENNRLEVFDLNQGLHMRADHVVNVPKESEVMRRRGIDGHGNPVNEEV